MRLRKLITPLALGVAAAAIIGHRRARRAAVAAQTDDFSGNDFASDPDDPVQGFDEASELQVMPLDVDALSQADAAAAEDLAELETELDEVADRDAAVFAVDDLVGRAHPRDTDELYGVHTPPAVERDLLDDDRAFDSGQNWIEALETSAIENGAEPERTLDEIIDESEVLRPPHASRNRDTPIADLGSAGRRGL